MADNVPITPGEGVSIASDDIGGVQYQRIKVNHGADGTARDASSGYPLPARAPALSWSSSDIDYGTNVDASVVYTAPGAGLCRAIGGIAWSYSGGTPIGGRITVSDGATIVFDHDIVTAGPGEFLFGSLRKGTANSALTVTLAAAGVGITGKLTVLDPVTVEA